MKKIISRVIDIILILLIIYLSFRLLQKKGIIESKLDKINKIPAFKVEDVYDNEITEKIFKEYDFTIVNIWSPFCGACLEELAALKELEPYIEENNGNVLGIVINSKKERALKTIEDLQLEFINAIPNKKFYKDFVKGVLNTPTTLFVDKDGNILKKSTGSYGKEGDIKYIKKAIEKLKF